MNDFNDSVKSMQCGLKALENNSIDEFDRVSKIFDIFTDSTTLIQNRYGPEILREWKAQDDPVFLRYASRLKTALEAQKAYLDSVETLFAEEDGVIGQKIQSRRSEIDSLLHRENTVLSEAGALFEAETELNERRRRVETLLQKKRELEQTAAEFAGVDIDALAAETESEQRRNDELHESVGPMREKWRNLKDENEALQSEILEIESDLERLETASAEQAAGIMDRMRQWTETIRSRKLLREEKANRFSQELAEETLVLKTLEQQIAGHLAELEKAGEKHAALQDILESHFQANEALGKRFARSLAHDEREADRLVSEIRGQLRRFDETLKNMHRKITETADEVQKIGI